MRRLVIGSGYLGARVAQVWADAGDEVYATTRGQRADALALAGLHPVRLDVTDVTPSTHLPPVDTVLFAVGRSPGTTMFDIHVAGLRAVLDALSTPTGRVIYVSSTGVYAQHDGEWVDEDSPCEPRHEGGRACLSGERLLLAHPHGRDARVLRLAGLYGPGRVPRAADISAGRMITGSPHAYLNLIHVEDAVRAVVTAAEVGPTNWQTYNVSDGHPPTRGEYARHLASQLKAAPPVFTGGPGLGKRVKNTRVLEALGLSLTYPSYREGLATVS